MFMPHARHLRRVVDIIIDASSIINLDNCGALPLVCRIQGRRIWISPIVIGECRLTCAASLLKLVQDGQFSLVDEARIPADTFLELLVRFDLGEGETECLTVCHIGDFAFCCDDARARRAGAELFGSHHVIGSLRLLRWAVKDGLLPPEEAFDAYTRMKRTGGFLPAITPEYFKAAR